MSTSLPKIKFIQDNSQSGSQKQLKFKKIKLTTDTSAADIRERFKSVRTQRLSSLQRYSTVQGQRQYKKEKIHLNLLERKLLTGTYDETKETGNDLNELKQKTDNYKIMSIQRQSQTQKIKQLIQQAKKQIQKYEIQKREKEQAVQKIHKRYDQQRIKTETSASERNCLQHMINQRKTINHFLQGRINQDKTYLGKLKAIVKQVQNQARQSTQYMKNLQLNASKLNNEMLREQRNREQIMYQKQYIINKRKEGEKVRVQKSNQFKKNLDEVELQIQKKDFMEYYNGILGNIFLRKFNQSSLEFLQKKYQVMQNSYNKICTYNKFKREQPIKMIDRLKQLKPQTLQLEQKIAQLQKRQGELEEKNKKLQKKSSQIRLISKIPVTSTEIRKIPVSKEINEQSRQHEQKEQQKKIEKLKGEILHTTQLLFKIDKWSQRYAKQFQLKIRRKPQETGMNINNILKCVQKDYGELKEKKVLASSQKKQELVG